MSRSTVRGLWFAGGVLFLFVAGVAVAVSAWAAVVAALLLAAVQFTISFKSPAVLQPPEQ